MTEEEINNENYEQMSVGSGDAPEPNIKESKNNNKIENKIINNKVIIIYLLIIIILGIYYIYITAYSSSFSEQNNNFQKEINILNNNQTNLQINNTKLIHIKNQFLDKNNEINVQIKQIKKKKLSQKRKKMK